jgi:hypothetical protein
VEAIALHVEAAARELSLESFAAFEDAFYARLFAFVHAAESHQKLGNVVSQLTFSSSLVAGRGSGMHRRYHRVLICRAGEESHQICECAVEFSPTSNGRRRTR